jgi:hypothetical protein
MCISLSYKYVNNTLSFNDNFYNVLFFFLSNQIKIDIYNSSDDKENNNVIICIKHYLEGVLKSKDNIIFSLPRQNG